MSNIIDFQSRKRTSDSAKAKSTNANNSSPVVDITERRNEAVNEERRQAKRTLLTEFIGVHTIVPGYGLFKVALYDINENGLSFDIETARGQFQVGEEIAMRVYVNHTTYFPFNVKVKNFRSLTDEGLNRHGCEFVKGSINDEALKYFVKFIETVALSLRSDRGDVLVSNIT
jgi:hypothetical protein